MTDFLLHLGYLSLSMSAVILLVLLWGGLFGRSFSAKSRYAVWAVVILSLCVGVALFRLPAMVTVDLSLPVQEAVVHDWPDVTPPPVETMPSVETLPPVAAPTMPAETLPAAPTSPSSPAKPTLDVDIPTLLFYLWAVGAVLFFGGGLAIYLRTTRRYARGKQLCDAETEAVFRTMCGKYRLRRLPRMYVCAAVGSPVLYGYVRPTILLPDIALTRNSLVGVLAHELTHYRRGDIWVKLACLLGESLHWFNPLVHLAAARCNAEMELSCDEVVLAGRPEEVRRAYGNVMLEIVRHCSRRRSGLTTQFNPRTGAVKERFVNILDMTKKRRGRVIIAAALALCLVAGVVFGCSVKREEEPEDTMEPTVYDDLSDFLNAEQIALYRTAQPIYALFQGEPGGIHTLHLWLEGADMEAISAYLGEISQEIGQDGRTVDGIRYFPARGKFQNYAEFEALCLSVFTADYFAELNRLGNGSSAFIAQDGWLYYADLAKGSAFGYAPDEYPDRYELISRSASEVSFNLIGHFKSSNVDPDYTVATHTFPIRMVLTDEGWRFSRFADAARSEWGIVPSDNQNALLDAEALTEHLVHSVMDEDWLDGADRCSAQQIFRFLMTLCRYADQSDAHPYAELVSLSADGQHYLITLENARKIAVELFGLFGDEGWTDNSYATEAFDAPSQTYLIPNGIGLQSSGFSAQNMEAVCTGQTVDVTCDIVNSPLYEAEPHSYGRYTFTFVQMTEEDRTYLRYLGMEKLSSAEDTPQPADTTPIVLLPPLSAAPDCTLHRVQYHTIPDALVRYVNDDAAVNAWLAGTPEANIHSFIRQFAIPREAFVALYTGGAMGHCYYWVDLLYDGTAKSVEEYYRFYRRESGDSGGDEFYGPYNGYVDGVHHTPGSFTVTRAKEMAEYTDQFVAQQSAWGNARPSLMYYLVKQMGLTRADLEAYYPADTPEAIYAGLLTDSLEESMQLLKTPYAFYHDGRLYTAYDVFDMYFRGAYAFDVDAPAYAEVWENIRTWLATPYCPVSFGDELRDYINDRG